MLVHDVIVYRNILCPLHTEGLVIYPETPTGNTVVPVSHECAGNAAVTGGGLMCTPNGTWCGSPSCGRHRIVGSECQSNCHRHTVTSKPTSTSYFIIIITAM